MDDQRSTWPKTKQRPTIPEKPRHLIPPPLPPRIGRPVPPPVDKPLQPQRFSMPDPDTRPKAAPVVAVPPSPTETDDWEEEWGADFDPYTDETPPQSTNINDAARKKIFGSNRVVPLNDLNYDNFVKSKEKTLVMFYDPFKWESVFPGIQYGKAADGAHQDKHAFAAVDCTLNAGLCCREGVSRMPLMKLYSNGFEFSKMEDTSNIHALQMHMLLKMTPVLHQPLGRPQSAVRSRR